MKKKEKQNIYLVANSHIDPVWQWTSDEGVSAALATFKSAANLLEKYDYVFCHNESLLYERVENADPELFHNIQKLVKEGKWKIMGGWYDQPDCLVPSGESFLRQISLGREYFLEKFGAKPTTALNFDSFGHTRGLVQILAKSGFDSYVFCRPSPDIDPIAHGSFYWEGYNGSKIKALRYEGSNMYCSTLGFAGRDIKKKIEDYHDEENVLVLWGVGNHGGIASASDLEQIAALQKEYEPTMDIKHSTLEEYFSSVDPEVTISRQFLALRKSYSSAREIKKAHDDLENQLSFSEKLGAISDLSGFRPYDREIYHQSEKDLSEIEFHDVLSGTAIKRGTLEAIDKARGAIMRLKEKSFNVFASAAEHLPPAIPGDSEFVIFNPHPYEYSPFIETEILAVYPNEKEDERYSFVLKDEKGNIVPNQIITEDSNINFDRRKRLVYRTSLPPMGFKALHVHYEIKPCLKSAQEIGQDIVISDANKTVVFSKETGAITSLIIGGKERLASPSFLPLRFEDSPDPWGWGVRKLGSNYKPFGLDASSKGIFNGLKSIDLIEEGFLLTSVQCLYSLGESHIVATYKIYKDADYFDIDFHVIWNEANNGLKLSISPKGEDGYFAEMAFGQEEYVNDGEEYPCGRYVGTRQDDEDFLLINNGGLHSVSKEGKEICLTFLNGSSYCAHPSFIKGRGIIPNEKKFCESIEQGTHDFSLRVSIAPRAEDEKRTSEFNEPPYSLEFFPHGKRMSVNKDLSLSNPFILLSCFKKLKDGRFLFRLYNGSEDPQSTILSCGGTKMSVRLGGYEFESFVFDGKSFTNNSDNGIF